MSPAWLLDLINGSILSFVPALACAAFVYWLETQYRDVLQRRLTLAHAHHHASLQVDDHLAALEIDAPGGEQRLEVRGFVGHELRHGIVRIRG